MVEPADVVGMIGAEEVASLAAGLVVAPGHNPPGEEGATVDVLAAACRLRGLEPVIEEVRPGRPNLRAVMDGADGPGLLLLGHSDVVPPGDGWTVHPYGGLVRDGRLYGRGAADMKGGLAACLVAMGAINRAGVRLSGPVELAVTVDEEDRALGVQHYLATGDRSGFRGCVVAEPTDLQPIVAARGDAYLKITISGRAAHAGDPDAGLNAIYGATRVIDDLRDWHASLAGDAHPLVGPATVSVGVVDGGTGPSIVPAECVVVADRRLLPAESGPEVLDQLRSRLAALGLEDEGLGVSAELSLDMPGFETEADAAVVQAIIAAAADAAGPQLPVGGWSAACDGGFLARDAKVPVVVYGPGSVSGQAHRADESVPVDQLVIAARVYALTILRTLGVS